MQFDEIANIDREVERIRNEEHCGPYSDDIQDDDPYGVCDAGRGDDGWGMEMKKHFVQCQHPDGEVSCGMFTEQQIIDMYGCRDFTGCEYSVYDVSEFGRAEKLMHLSDSFQEPRYHRFVKMTYPREIIFSGFSPEH